jgi:septum formation inhibitor MinC
MSDDKSKVSDKASEIAKNIWLAGVGAYGKAVDEAQDRLEKAGVETPKLFRDLVKAGAALEKEATDKTDSRSARSSVEERISKVRENFYMQRPARIEDLADLHQKVDLLSLKLDILTNALTEAGIVAAKPKSPRKAAAKKAPAKKAASKKAAPRKAATKKAPARKKATSRPSRR